MKNYLAFVLLVVAGMFFINSRSHHNVAENTMIHSDSLLIPENVKAVIDHSCYMCHNTDAKNEDSKKAVNFDKLGSLKTFALIGVLENMEEVIDEGKMPPEKFLERYPDHALTKENKEILLAWVRETKKEKTTK